MNFPKILIYFIWPYYVSSSGIGERTISRKRYGISLSECPETKVLKLTEDASNDVQAVEAHEFEPMDTFENTLGSPLDDQTVIRKDQIDKNTHIHPILKIPDELGILIYSYLRCPYSNLTRVCKLFNENMKKYPLGLHLSFISSIESTVSLKPSKDLARLMKLDNTFLNERFGELLSARSSYFTLATTLFTDQTVRFLLKTYEGFRLFYELRKIKIEIMTCNFFESFLTVLKLIPDYKIQQEFLESDFVLKFLKFLRNDESTFLDNLVLFMKSVRFCDTFLQNLFTLPDISDFGSIAPDFDLKSFDKDVVLKSIAESFSLLDFDGLSAEQIEFIQERNRKYIDQCSTGHSSKFLVYFAKICSELISNNYEDKELKTEFFNSLLAHVTASSKSKYSNHALMGSFFDILLRIAIKRRFLKLFSQLTSLGYMTTDKYIQSINSRLNLKNYSDFVSTFPLFLFKRVFDIRGASGLLKYNKLTWAEACGIKDLEERLVAQIELDPDYNSTQERILNFLETSKTSLPQLITNILSQTNNPARSIHKVLYALKDRNIPDEIFSDVIYLLKSNAYLVSLIKPENEDIFEFPHNELYLKVDKFSIETFLELAKTIGSERIQPLTKHLVIDWQSIVRTPGLLASDLDSFFKVLGLNISTYDVFLDKHKQEDLDAIESITRDSRCLFVEPKINPKYIFEILLTEVNSAFDSELSIPNSIANNETNPFRLKFFGIYEFILEKNLEVFVSFVPDQVFAAFKPKIPRYLVKKALFNPLYREKFANRVLNASFPEGTIHKITVETVSELEIYFTTFYPKIYPFYGKFYLKVYIDWESIINNAKLEKDFLAIIAALQPSEFQNRVLTLKRTPKIDQFINEYIKNRDFVQPKFIEKDYLTAFTPK